MRRLFGISIAFTLCMSLACAAPRERVKREPCAVRHVVFLWLKAKPGTPAYQKALGDILQAAEKLKTIPGIVDIHPGYALPSTKSRKVAEASYDLAFLFTVQDEESLLAYEDHPTHMAVVKSTLTPLVKKIQVYDFGDLHREPMDEGRGDAVTDER